MMVRRGSCRASPRHCVSGRAPRRSRCVGARAVVAVQSALADIAARSAGGVRSIGMEGVRVRPADERPAVPARAIGGRRLRRGWSACQGGDACSVSHRPGAQRLRACCHERRAVEVQRAGTAVRRWRWSDRGREAPGPPPHAQPGHGGHNKGSRLPAQFYLFLQSFALTDAFGNGAISRSSERKPLSPRERGLG